MRRLVFWDVDTQHDFIDPTGALYVPGAETLVGNLERLTHAARALGATIVASVDDHGESDSEISSHPDFRSTFPPHCISGTRGQEKVPATRLRDPIVIDTRAYGQEELAGLIPQRGGEILIKKRRFDVFSNPATETLVRILRPEPAIVYGVAQDVCVDHAIRGLVAAGFRVHFVEDASRAMDGQAAARCADTWRRLGVAFTTTEAVVAGTDRSAAGRLPPEPHA